MKPANGVPSWITQAVEELGPEIGYSNLIYWAYENMIKAEEVDKTLKALVNMGFHSSPTLGVLACTHLLKLPPPEYVHPARSLTVYIFPS